MSHSRVSLGPHCNSLHHERCGKADSGNRGGRCVQGPAPGLQGAPLLLLPRAPSSHFGFLPPSNKSFVEPGVRRRETRILPSRGFQAPAVELLSHRGGESDQRDLLLPQHHAAGHLVAPPCLVPESQPIARLL